MEILRLENESLLLSFSGMNILVDCSLDVKHLAQSPLPSLKPTSPIQFSTKQFSGIPPLDLVLISNSTRLRALPFLHSHDVNAVLMTELVSKLGQSLCKQWVDFDAQYRRKVAGSTTLYSKDNVSQIWQKVRTLSYNQVFPYNNLVIIPLSSGHSLGACNWLIRWEDISIGICCESSVDPTRYPSSFDRALLSSDYLLFSASNNPELKPYNQKTFFNSFLEACRSLPIQSTLVVPIESWHILQIESHILQAASTFGLPVLCMSSSAKAYLSYASGSTDWLNPELKQRAYSPQNCFSFQSAKEKKVFSVFSSLQDGFGKALVPNCILLVSHSSLRFGESDYVLNHLARKRGLHLLYQIDPDFSSTSNDLYQANIMNHFLVHKEFISVGLSAGNIEEFIGISTAKKILLPEGYQFNNANVQYYSKQLSLEITPRAVSLQTYIKAPCAVRGRFLYNNYERRAEFIDRAEALKMKLKESGYEVVVASYYNYTVVRVMGGEIIFRGRKTEVKGKTRDIRKALIAFLAQEMK